MRFRWAILALTVCAAPWAAPGAALAQPIQGVYVSGGAGAGLPFKVKTSTNVPGFSGTFDIGQNVGFDSQASVGYAFGNGWRLELEGTLGQSNINGITGASYLTTGSGNIRNIGAMGNALFDLDVRSPYVFPYIGVGIGYQSTRLSDFSVTRAQPLAVFSTSGTANSFAWQGIAGLSFPIPNQPGLSIITDYRFMDITSGGTFGGASTVGPGLGSIKLHNQYVQSFLIGVRYAFDTPMPAALTQPAPAAAAEPVDQARSFVVQFDPGSTSLDRRAQAVMAAAAQDAASGRKTRVAVTGGDADPALARRRAQVVAAALVGAGVPWTRISVQAQEVVVS